MANLLEDMASVSVKQLVKRFDQNIAVNHLDLDVKDGEFMVFLGPSGCGKTTTLRCISGLEIPDDGEIRIGDEIVTKKEPAERDIAFVFQSFSLYPHMTVREILSFPLRAVRTPEAEIQQRVAEAAKTLHIEKLLERKPGKLSGGEMQRVAIGRAIVRRPKVFLMDEPLSALDAKLRTEMRAEIKRLQTDLGQTTIYVTHDQLEAMSMGDKIAIMYGGLLQQIGTPTEVYDYPKKSFCRRVYRVAFDEFSALPPRWKRHRHFRRGRRGRCRAGPCARSGGAHGQRAAGNQSRIRRPPGRCGPRPRTKTGLRPRGSLCRRTARFGENHQSTNRRAYRQGADAADLRRQSRGNAIRPD